MCEEVDAQRTLVTFIIGIRPESLENHFRRLGKGGD